MVCVGRLKSRSFFCRKLPKFSEVGKNERGSGKNGEKIGKGFGKTGKVLERISAAPRHHTNGERPPLTLTRQRLGGCNGESSNER